MRLIGLLFIVGGIAYGFNVGDRFLIYNETVYEFELSVPVVLMVVGSLFMSVDVILEEPKKSTRQKKPVASPEDQELAHLEHEMKLHD
jgi:hypothetical protein